MSIVSFVTSSQIVGGSVVKLIKVRENQGLAINDLAQFFVWFLWSLSRRDLMSLTPGVSRGWMVTLIGSPNGAQLPLLLRPVGAKIAWWSFPPADAGG